MPDGSLYSWPGSYAQAGQQEKATTEGDVQADLGERIASQVSARRGTPDWFCEYRLDHLSAKQCGTHVCNDLNLAGQQEGDRQAQR